MLRLILLLAVTVSPAGPCHARMAAEKRDSRVSVVARSAAKKIERGFRKVGGHPQKFFTGRDTITK